MRYNLPKELKLDDVTGLDRHYSQKRIDARLVRKGRKIFYERMAWLPDPAYGGKGRCWRFGSTKINPIHWLDSETDFFAKELVPEWYALVTDDDIIMASLLSDYSYSSVRERMKDEDLLISIRKKVRSEVRKEILSEAEIRQLKKTD